MPFRFDILTLSSLTQLFGNKIHKPMMLIKSNIQTLLSLRIKNFKYRVFNSSITIISTLKVQPAGWPHLIIRSGS